VTSRVAGCDWLDSGLEAALQGFGPRQRKVQKAIATASEVTRLRRCRGAAWDGVISPGARVFMRLPNLGGQREFCMGIVNTSSAKGWS
jgi:hypothetical protein